MCLVIQAFSLILYILRNSGSVNAMIFFFKAICLLRSIPASLECLNLLTKNKRKQNKSLMDIFPLNKSSMAFIALQRNCTKGLYSVKAQTSTVSRCDVCKLVLNLKSLAKNWRKQGYPVCYCQCHKKESNQLNIHPLHQKRITRGR